MSGTNARISQDSLAATTVANPYARVSQDSMGAVVLNNPNAKVSQDCIAAVVVLPPQTVGPGRPIVQFWRT